MDVRTRNLVEIHLSVVLFGLTGLFGKFISLPAPHIVLGRVFFASVSMGLYFLFRKKNVRLARAADYAAMAAVGAVLALHWTAFYLSVKLSTVAIGVLTFAAYPIFVTFLEPFFFREKLRGADVLAAFVMFGGVLLVVPRTGAGPDMTAGMIWGMVGSVSYAVMSLLNRKFVSRYEGSVVAFYEQGTARRPRRRADRRRALALHQRDAQRARADGGRHSEPRKRLRHSLRGAPHRRVPDAARASGRRGDSRHGLRLDAALVARGRGGRTGRRAVNPRRERLLKFSRALDILSLKFRE